MYKPVLQFDLSGNFIKEWKSARDAAITLGISQKGIYWCCVKKYKKCLKDKKKTKVLLLPKNSSYGLKIDDVLCDDESRKRFKR